MELAVISTRLGETIGFVKALFGEDRLKPVPIVDEKALNAAQENIVTLKDLKKAVDEYFKPLKVEARKPYDQLLDQERQWNESIDDVTKFVNAQIKAFNDKVRAEIQAREQAEADERARIAREKLEQAKKEAESAGNAELAQQIAEEAQNTVAAEVSEKKMMNRGDLSTMSEAATIEDFEIVNHVEFATALMGGGLGNLIILDKKVETAFKKYLLTNKDVKAYPGVKFRRDYKILHKTRHNAD